MSGGAGGLAADWVATRWVSDPAAIHLAGPGGVEFDLLPDDDSDAGCFLRALAHYLLDARMTTPAATGSEP